MDSQDNKLKMEKSGLHFKPGVSDNRTDQGRVCASMSISPCSNSAGLVFRFGDRVALFIARDHLRLLEIMNSSH